MKQPIMKNKSEVVASAYGDVTGDKIPDNVYLIGNKPSEDSDFIENITLIVQNGKTNKMTKVQLKENAGYNPSIFLGDFTGVGVKDILIKIDSGGSGGFIFAYVYSMLKNQPRLLFSSDTYNSTLNYDVVFQDYYKVDVMSLSNNYKYIISLENKDPEYLDSIYSKNGTLKKKIIGFVGPLAALYPIDVFGDGVYELLAMQKIAGLYDADILGYVQNYLRFDNRNFIIYDQNVAILGAGFNYDKK